MRYLTSYIWEQGKRAENEDSFAVFHATVNKTPFLMAAVADGIGGLYKSENASSHVTYSLKTVFEQATHSSKSNNIKYLQRLICRTLHGCHKKLKNYSFQEGIQTGTTCSVVILKGIHGFIINVGDSRVYKYSSLPGKCRLITKDRNTINGVLSNCIGAGTYIRPKIKKIRLRKRDALLICTDGFYRRIHRELLQSIMQVNDAEELMHWLKSYNEISKKRGEADNSTAIIVSRIN